MATPVYTLRHWINTTDFTDTPLPIYLDDKTAHIHAIAASMFKVPRVYMWVQTVVQDRVTFIRDLVESIFQKRPYVVYEVIVNAFKIVFPEATLTSNYGRTMRVSHTEAYTLLQKYAPNVVDVPLCFDLKTVVGVKHIFPVNPFTNSESQSDTDVSIFDTSNLVIHDHFPLNNVINVVLISQSDTLTELYFPKDTILPSVVKRDFAYEHIAAKLVQSFIPCFLKRIRYEVKPIGPPQQINLRSIFTTLALDTATPLVKMQNGEEIVYKIDSDAIKSIPPAILDEFTKMYSKQKKIAHYVAVMLFFGEHYAKLTFSQDGTYEVKVSFENVHDKSESHVWNVVAPYVNHTLIKIRGIIINPLFMTPFLTKEMVYSGSCCSEVIMRANFTFAKIQSIQAIEMKILKLSTIFHKNYNIVHKAQNKLAVRYRRCSTLNPDFDVAAFIQTKLDIVPRYELVDMLMEMFGMSRERASSRINEVSSVMTSPFSSAQNHNDGVTIEITRTNDMEIVVFVKGSFLDKEMIVHILRVVRTCLDSEIVVKTPRHEVVIEDDNIHSSTNKFFDSDSDSDSNEKIFDDDDGVVVVPDTSNTSNTSSTPTPTSTPNAKRYTIKRLQEADPALFNYSDANFKSYAMNCAANERRQPIVVPKDDVSKFNKSAYTNVAVLGDNAYICPQVWCTHSGIPMSLDEFNKNKCPSPLDTAIHLHEKNADTKKFVGFLDPSKHPQEACVPCCFLVDHTTKSAGKLKGRFGKCVGSAQDAQDTSGQGYIKSDTVFPLENGRFGRIPQAIAQHVDNDIVRKGIPHKGRYFMSCMEAVLQLPENTLEETIVKNIRPHDFVCIPDIVRDFMDTTSSIMHDVNYFNFRKWFLKEQQYVILFSLQKVQAYVKQHVSPETLAPPMLWELKREFIVYMSMMQFLHYIQSDAQKDLRILPLFGKPWLNSTNVTIIVLDDDAAPNVGVHHSNNNSKSDKYALVMKHEKFYEQLCSVSGRHIFDTGAEGVNDIVKAINDSVLNTIDTQHKDIIAKLHKIGHPPKKQVVNVDFKVCGVITTSGVYVSFPGTGAPIEYHTGLSCVYKSMAHEWASPSVKKHVLDLVGQDATGVLDVLTDLHIFTGVQLKNPVTEFIGQWNKENVSFNGGVKAIVIEIIHKEQMLKEFEFLRNPNNFFSRQFKIRMMINLVHRTRASRTVSAELVPRIAEVLLTRELALLTADTHPVRESVYVLTQEQVNRGDMYSRDSTAADKASSASVSESVRPVRFQTLLPSGFRMLSMDLYDVFGQVSSTFADRAKAVEYVANTIEEVVPDDVKYHPILQDTTDVRVMLEIMLGPAYKPGVMEAKILAKGANVGLILIGTRRDLDVPAPSKLVFPGPVDKYIVLHYEKDTTKWKIVYDDTLNDKRFVYTSDELGSILD